MTMFRIPVLAALVALLLLSGCTTYWKRYQAGSYMPVVDPEDNMLVAYEGTPTFEEVDDMQPAADRLYTDGFAMIGYSQFVSPLLPSLAESTSTTMGESIGAQHVVAQTPQHTSQLNHYWLVTYWKKVDPSTLPLGIYMQDISAEALKEAGLGNNFVTVEMPIKGTPAAAAGLQPGDVIVAFNEQPVLSADELGQSIREHAGKPARILVSRGSGLEDIQVQLQPLPDTIPKTGATALYQRAPWLNSSTTDWSHLGDLGRIMAQATAQAVANYQAQEQARQQAYLESQRQAQQNAYQSSYSSRSSSVYDDCPPGEYRSGRRGGSGTCLRGTPPSERKGLVVDKEQARKNWDKWVEDYYRNSR